MLIHPVFLIATEDALDDGVVCETAPTLPGRHLFCTVKPNDGNLEIHWHASKGTIQSVLNFLKEIIEQQGHSGRLDIGTGSKGDQLFFEKSIDKFLALRRGDEHRFETTLIACPLTLTQKECPSRLAVGAG